jgi:sulfite reductase (NADPH) hemoprotein beta-component
MSDQVLTANRLSDGAVVYLTARGTWSEWITDSRIARDAAASAALLADGLDVSDGQVADAPYLIDVTTEGGNLRPLRHREQIRASGPSIRPVLNKQTAIKRIGADVSL